MVIYFEYNEAVGNAQLRKFSPAITSVKARISEALEPQVNEDWNVTRSLEKQPNLTFALEYLSTKAGTDSHCKQRFVVFAYSEESMITLRRCLQAWPQNARGVIVVVGEGKAKNFLSKLMHEVQDSKRAKDKILTVVAEMANNDPATLRNIVAHLTKKK